MENPGKQNYFASKSSEELERILDTLLCGDNFGGMLANDIIDELGKRREATIAEVKR
jgi:hypothetical protein